MRRSTQAAAVALLSGFALMSLEMTAVRLLAPHFGDSAPVWTNVIGVVLAALAAGAWIGGKWADRGGAGVLHRTLWAAALLTAVIPLWSGPLGRWLLPSELPLDAAMGALIRGSLVATTLLFAPPALLLGAVGPLLVARLAAHGPVGWASGLSNAFSTLGCLAGTFGTTHWLVPGIGSRATILLCAALLAIAALLVRRTLPVAGVGVLLIGVASLDLGPLRPLPEGGGQVLLAEVESSYQFLQVVEDTSGPRRTTALKINEGLDSFHSIAIDGTPWTDGRYYDWHALAPLLSQITSGQGLRVASLGSAAGTFGRLYEAVWPGCIVDEIEIDPAVVELGRRHFGGLRAMGDTFAGIDARVFAEYSDVRYDVILVDTYERQIYVPAHVASVEFFDAILHRLVDGGVVSINVGGFSPDDPVVRAIGATMARVFGSSFAFRIPKSRNLMLVAQRYAVPAPVERMLEAADRRSTEFGPNLDPDLQQLARLAARPHLWTPMGPDDGEIVTDDVPLLDRLTERAFLAQSVDVATPTPTLGSKQPSDVAEDAAAALRDENPEAVLALLRETSRPDSYLRLLAGDARWLGHDMAGAVVEYRDALALGPTDAIRSSLDARLQNATTVLEGRERGFAIGRRNGWLAVVTLAAFAAVCFVAFRRRDPTSAVAAR